MWVQILHPVPDRVKPSFVIFDIGALCPMSKITNDGLTGLTQEQDALLKWQQWASKGLTAGKLADVSDNSVASVVAAVVHMSD